MNIDVSDVKTMGQFRVGIQNAVENYVSNEITKAVQGVHSIQEYPNVFAGGAKQDEVKTLSIDLHNVLTNKSQYWAVINIVNKAYGYGKFNAQILVWQDENGQFKYSIPRNMLFAGGNTESLSVRQYISAVSFDSKNSILNIEITNTYWDGYASLIAVTKKGSYIIDYHIW